MKLLGAAVQVFTSGTPPSSHRKDKGESGESSLPGPMAGGGRQQPQHQTTYTVPLPAGGRVRLLDWLRGSVPGVRSLSSLGICVLGHGVHELFGALLPSM